MTVTHVTVSPMVKKEKDDSMCIFADRKCQHIRGVYAIMCIYDHCSYHYLYPI